MRVGAELHDGGGAGAADDTSRARDRSTVLVEAVAGHVIAAKALLEREGVEARVGLDRREGGAVARHVVERLLLVHVHAGAEGEAGRRVVLGLIAFSDGADGDGDGSTEVGWSVRGIGVG